MFNLLTRNWWVLVVKGVIAIVFGVLAFSQPGIILGTLILLAGAFVFVDGIFSLVLAFGGWEARDDRWLFLLEGLLGVGIGIMTYRAPERTAVILMLYIAAWSLAMGVLKIAAAIRLRKVIEGEGWLALSGVASLVFAAILLWQPPAGTLGLLWFLASYAIVYGAILIVVGLKVRGLRGRLKEARA